MIRFNVGGIMSIRTLRVCDRCGKEEVIAPNVTTSIFGVSIELGSKEIESVETDMCYKCRHELRSIVSKFLSTKSAPDPKLV